MSPIGRTDVAVSKNRFCGCPCNERLAVWGLDWGPPFLETPMYSNAIKRDSCEGGLRRGPRVRRGSGGVSLDSAS